MYSYPVVLGFVMTLSVYCKPNKMVWWCCCCTAGSTRKQQDWCLRRHECLVDHLRRKWTHKIKKISHVDESWYKHISSLALVICNFVERVGTGTFLFNDHFQMVALKWFITRLTYSCHTHIWVLCADSVFCCCCKKVLCTKWYILAFLGTDVWYLFVSMTVKCWTKERKGALLCFCVLHRVLSLLRNIMMPSW